MKTQGAEARAAVLFVAITLYAAALVHVVRSTNGVHGLENDSGKPYFEDLGSAMITLWRRTKC